MNNTDKLISAVLGCRPIRNSNEDGKSREFELEWPILNRKGKRLNFFLENPWCSADPNEFAEKMLSVLDRLGRPKPWKSLKLATSMMLRRVQAISAGLSPEFEPISLSIEMVELIDYTLSLPDPKKSRSAPEDFEKYWQAIEYEARHPKATINQVRKKCGVSFHTVAAWRKQAHYQKEKALEWWRRPWAEMRKDTGEKS